MINENGLGISITEPSLDSVICWFLLVSVTLVLVKSKVTSITYLLELSAL